MKAYFDTSLIVTLTTMEERWTDLAAWISKTMPTPVYSDFGWGEYISAIGLKVRRGNLGEDEARTNVAEVREYLRSWTRVRTTRGDLLAGADMLSDFALALRFPDAIHIATAKRMNHVLLTGDAKQQSAAIRFGVETINPFE